MGYSFLIRFPGRAVIIDHKYRSAYTDILQKRKVSKYCFLTNLYLLYKLKSELSKLI